MTPRCVWLWNRVSLFWWKFCSFFFFKDGDTHACPCVSRRTSVAYLAVMTSWWGTRDTGFYTRNNRKSSHCTGALPLIDSQLNVWLVTNNRLAVARAAHCEVGELVTDGKLICYRVCLISLFPFHSFFPLYPLGSFPETKPPFFLLHCYKVALQCSSCLKVHLCVDQMRAGSNRRPLPAVCVACTFLAGTGIWLPPLPVPFWSLRVCVCQCGSWSGILNAVYSCCGWLVKARYGRQLVIRLIMLPLCEVGVMWLLSAVHIVLLGGNLSRLNVLNVVRDVLLNA